MGLDRRTFLLAAGASVAHLMSSSHALAHSVKPLLPPLVFIPGLKGSELRDAEGVVRWFTLSEGLGLTSPDLRLPLKWRATVQQRDTLVASGPLRSVGWHEVYAPFLTWAAASGRVFRGFGYDWRRDNLETTDEFIRYVDNISRENGGARVQIVAHSMGGLIAFVALNRRPDLIHSILLAGVPFGGSVNFLEDMHVGTSNGLNQRILSPQVLFTFPSLYCFFPTDLKNSGLIDEHGNQIDHDWFSVDDWARKRVGIFANSGSESVSAAERDYLANALARARQFVGLLAYKVLPRSPAIAVLASEAHPTLYGAVRNGPRAIKGWDFESFPRRPGDGRVYFEGAMPPPGVPHRVFQSSQTHEGLLNNATQVESILAELCK